MIFNDIICAPATIPGTGAISVIRVSGKGSLELADKIIKLKHGNIANSKGYTLHFGEIRQDDGSLIDEVLVSIFRAPHSYTGEDSIEISTHASKYIVNEILCQFTEKGEARLAGPGEFTQRAYLNGKMDLAQAEAVADVIAADSKAALRVAQNQLKGGYSESFRKLRDQLVRLSALLELELDFSEEEVEFANRRLLKELAESAIERMTKLKDSFRTGNALKNGIPVAIVGAPNAGKSTLLNALLGEDRAIISDIPGTTRDTVEESIVIGGVRYRFIDTAGIRETDEAIEKLGINRSLEKIKDASIIICLLDTSNIAESHNVLQKVKKLINPNEQNLIIVENKCDLHNDIIPHAIRISALKREGLKELVSAIDSLGIWKKSESETIITSARHYRAICEAITSMENVIASISSNQSEELLAEDLRDAISSLNSIFASTADKITPNEVLGEVFRNFCVGK